MAHPPLETGLVDTYPVDPDATDPGPVEREAHRDDHQTLAVFVNELPEAAEIAAAVVRLAGIEISEPYTLADQNKLANIETAADVTDEANVVAALDGATLPTVTVAATDRVLVLDADGALALKTATAQAVGELGGTSAGSVSRTPVLRDGTITQAHVSATGRGSPDQQTVDFRLLDAADGSTVKATLTSIVVPAGSFVVHDPPSAFTRVAVAGDIIEFVRTGGTGTPPQGDVWVTG